MRRIAEQSRIQEIEPEEEMLEEEEEWYEEAADEYLAGEETPFEEELEGVEEVKQPAPIIEIEEDRMPEEKSSFVVAEQLMDHILECVAQIAENETWPSSPPSEHSAETAEAATTTDLEEGCFMLKTKKQTNFINLKKPSFQIQLVVRQMNLKLSQVAFFF